VLRGVGGKLEPITLPEFPANALGFILSAEAAAAFDDLTRSKGIDQLTEQGPGAWPNTFRTSRFIPAVEYIRAQRARTLLTREMEALMSRERQGGRKSGIQGWKVRRMERRRLER